MTTTIIINAHCATDTQVEIYLSAESDTENNPIVLQDGETHELHVYDDRQVTVREVKK